MSEDEFDGALWTCARQQAAARDGNDYSWLSNRNSNSFVRHTVGCAGGEVPPDADANFSFGAPGLQGGSDSRAAQRAIEREQYFRELQELRAARHERPGSE
jgi:hypothetical protein